MRKMAKAKFSMAERSEALRLAVCRHILKRGFSAMEARIAECKGVKRDLALCCRLIDKSLDLILDTLAPAQALMFEQSLTGIAYEIGTKCPATWHNEAKAQKEKGMWLTFEVLNALLDGCQEGCLYCDKDTEGQLRCPTRKALNLLPQEGGPEDDGKGRCQYYGANWNQ